MIFTGGYLVKEPNNVQERLRQLKPIMQSQSIGISYMNQRRITSSRTHILNAFKFRCREEDVIDLHYLCLHASSLRPFKIMAPRRRQNLTISNAPESSRQRIESCQLPEDLVQAIVAFLPPKEIAKLSIMSKRFRYTWKSCHDLSFDISFAKRRSVADYKNIVSQFFQDRGNANIDKFKLYFNPTNDKELVLSWIDKCVRMGIKELDLDFTPSPTTCVLGSYLLQVQTLRILRLSNLQLDLSKLPPNCVSNLSELMLELVKIKPETVKTIFSNCLELKTFEFVDCSSIYNLNIFAHKQKGLKELVVKYCNDICSIRINAPTLSSLHYHGKLCEFIFYCHFPRLEDVILDIKPPRGFQVFPHREDVVAAIKNVRTLTVTCPFLEMLFARFEDNQYRELEFYLMNLREFHLIVDPESYINPLDIAMFLKRCPQIERVFIDLRPNSFVNSMFWDIHGRASLSQFHITFPSIKSVKIKGFTSKELHVTMARFFLKLAKYLEYLVLVKAKNHEFAEIFTPEYLRREIESPAKIEVYEHRRDKSAIVPKHLKNE